MSVTIADKLAMIAANEQKVYMKGYDAGYDNGRSEGGGNGEENCKAEVLGSFSVTENGEYTYTSNDGEVFASVKVKVDVPSDSGGGDDGEMGEDVSKMLFKPNCGDKWICPPVGEGETSFYMMSVDVTQQNTAYGITAGTMVPGKRYKAVFKPMNPNNLWENFVFGKSDYWSLAVVANDASVGQYVTKVAEDTFIFTVPPECALVFLNGDIQYGCRVYALE